MPEPDVPAEHLEHRFADLDLRVGVAQVGGRGTGHAWLSSVGIGIRIDGNSTSYRGEVYDLSGRRLHRFFGVGNQGMVWDGHTEQGDLARPGIYFLRVVSAGKSATTRVVLLR